jgi:hypothetical protein
MPIREMLLNLGLTSKHLVKQSPGFIERGGILTPTLEIGYDRSLAGQVSSAFSHVPN